MSEPFNGQIRAVQWIAQYDKDDNPFFRHRIEQYVNGEWCMIELIELEGLHPRMQSYKGQWN